MEEGFWNRIIDRKEAKTWVSWVSVAFQMPRRSLSIYEESSQKSYPVLCTDLLHVLSRMRDVTSTQRHFNSPAIGWR